MEHPSQLVQFHSAHLRRCNRMQISPEIWIDHTLNFDQSLSYIQGGGSLIRFVVVSDDETHESLDNKIDELRTNDLLWVFSAKAGPEVPFNRPDFIVHSLANNLPDGIADVLDNLCVKIWKSLGSSDPGLILTHDVARHLDQDPEYIQRKFNLRLNEILGRSLGSSHDLIDESLINRSYTRDFSNAIKSLCLDLTTGSDTQIDTFSNWLKDEPTTPRDLRKLGIMSRIKRDNASSTLRSLIALHTDSDDYPSVLHLDIRHLTDANLFSDHELTWRVAKPSIIGSYQWLRELIDQTSLFRNTLIIVEAGPSFPDISPIGKGVGIYDALKNRITDDVSVIGQVNASAVLVPIGY